MFIRIAITGVIAAAAPAVAGDISRTHAPAVQPAGKGPVLYRQLSHNDCQTRHAPHANSGKLTWHKARQSDTCAQLAARAAAKATATADR